MNALSRWLERRRVDRELADEMAEHLVEKIEQLRAEGLPEQEARMIARRQFGNLTYQMEESRAAWGWNLFEQVWGDVRFGWRVLAKTPGFTVTAILVLALGIGMNTAMFSAVKAVLLGSLPYPEPERIIELRQTAKDGHLMNVSWLDFRDWRAQSRTIERMSAYGVDGLTISGSFRPRRVQMAAVSSGFFDVMATGASIGRTFRPEEQKPGAAPTIVLGYELAHAVFGLPGSAIDKTVRLNGMAFVVIGVMPPKFNFPDGAQVWLPNEFFPDDSVRSAHNYRIVGRLRRGVTAKQAQLDMNVVAQRLGKEYADDKDEGIHVASLYEFLVGGIRPALLVLLGAVGLVLLIACVNISNLQLARAAARQKEMVMRYALGAGRGRLIRQLLTENVLLAGAGGIAALVLAEVGIRAIRFFAPGNMPRLENLGIDSGVLCFNAGLSLLAGILFGVLPSFESAKGDANDALKQSSGKGEAIPHKRWGQVLVIAQSALAILLLSGAALLMKSYWKLVHVETGLASGGVYVADLTWPASADGNSVDGNYVRDVGLQMLEQINNLPGVQTSALIHGLPYAGAPDGNFEIEGRPLPADPHSYPDADYRMVTPDYFKAFGLPLLRGRGFTKEDGASAQQMALVNRAFEKAFFPNGEIIGKRIRFLGFDRKPQFMIIIGVVPDVRASNLRTPAVPEVFADYFQHADSAMDAALVVRGPQTLETKIEQIVTSLNHSTAVNFESMNDVIAGTIGRERFQTGLLGVFAGCALPLAVLGVYGLLSYTVARRTSELGVRMALGASRAAIARLVLQQGGVLVLIGLAVGLFASLLATRVLRSMLFQISTTDPAAMAAVVLTFIAAALLGCYLPARRAARIDPAEALRTE